MSGFQGVDLVQQQLEQFLIRVLQQFEEDLALRGIQLRVTDFQEALQEHIQLQHAAAAAPLEFGQTDLARLRVRAVVHSFFCTRRSLILPMARVGLSSFGQTWTQFMMVWQR